MAAKKFTINKREDEDVDFNWNDTPYEDKSSDVKIWKTMIIIPNGDQIDCNLIKMITKENDIIVDEYTGEVSEKFYCTIHINSSPGKLKYPFDTSEERDEFLDEINIKLLHKGISTI